jgi:hypothetical protein
VRARDNPFAVARLGALTYRLQAGESLDGLLARFHALGRRAALVGPEGHGKTTLMGELAARLASEGWRLRRVVLRRGERRLRPAERTALLAGAGERDLLLVDGAQELAPLAWIHLRWAGRRAGGLLVTSHRAGLLPTLHHCETTPELLAGLIAELLAGRPAPPPGLPGAAELFARYRGDVRQALLAAYDSCARAPEPPAPQGAGGLARTSPSTLANVSAQ